MTRTGRMLAQAVTGTPGHVNAMADAVPHFIRRIGPENIFEGDVYITNDPWEGTGHLHDITVVTPSFHSGASGRVLRLHRPCRRYRRARLWRGCGQRLRGRPVHPDHEVRRARRGRRDPDPDRARQCARTRSAGRRHLCAGHLQRDRPPPADRHDGRIRAGRSGRHRGLHPGKLAPRHAGTDRRPAPQVSATAR